MENSSISNPQILFTGRIRGYHVTFIVFHLFIYLRQNWVKLSRTREKNLLYMFILYNYLLYVFSIAWWLSGRFGALCPEGHRFESHSCRHVGTLGPPLLAVVCVLTLTQYQCCIWEHL